MGKMAKTLVVLFAVILTLGLFGETVIFDEKYFKELSVKENLKLNLKSDMRFIALDYMNEPEISKCKDLHVKLADNMKNWVAVHPKKYADIECDKDIIKEMFLNELIAEPEYYDLGEQGLLIAGKDKNGLKLFRYFDTEVCGFDHDTRFKNMLATDSGLIIKIDDEYFLVSEWFSRGRYVFYYLNKAPEYNEVNCRFDVI